MFSVWIHIQVEETVESQYVPLVQEEALTEEHVAALQDNGDESTLQAK